MAVTHFDFRLYFLPWVAKEQAAQLLKQIAVAAGVHLGHALEPISHSRDEWERADPEILSGGSLLRHAALAERSGLALWSLSFRYMDLRRHQDMAAITGHIPLLPIDERKKSLSYLWLMQALPMIVSGIKPDLCMVNASGDSDRMPTNELLLSGPDVPPGQLPAVFTPWVYLGPTRLTPERRKALAELPAFRSEPLGEGWLVQAVEDFFEPPAEGFTRALEMLPNPRPVGWRQPSMGPTRGSKRPLVRSRK